MLWIFVCFTGESGSIYRFKTDIEELNYLFKVSTTVHLFSRIPFKSRKNVQLQ